MATCSLPRILESLPPEPSDFRAYVQPVDRTSETQIRSSFRSLGAFQSSVTSIESILPARRHLLHPRRGFRQEREVPLVPLVPLVPTAKIEIRTGSPTKDQADAPSSRLSPGRPSEGVSSSISRSNGSARPAHFPHPLHIFSDRDGGFCAKPCSAGKGICSAGKAVSRAEKGLF